ncbi:flagellar basal body rod protein FlgC (plasmid) [Sphingomonas paeninsulae]|uniref:Flagellar basal-body rod protein FlgC n=2 Tax=Sphingomonas paeninsulae TaxID=2319844 RepID=A0A494TH99_SPHPE|nr:flagellar basal body rod protein FlgC [Sphingomonas paeninsulae]AYJ85216.1 flagellar basal body rod protein FlgC [Sphingomonas paeninsulae]
MAMNVFDIAGRAMSAQLVRLNTTASNLANAGSVSGTEAGAFRALKPIFRAVGDQPGVATVQVDSVIASNTPATRRHEPNHPMADKNGDVWEAGVDSTAEMVEMIEAARQYQNNVQVLETAKSLTLDTLRIGK